MSYRQFDLEEKKMAFLREYKLTAPLMDVVHEIQLSRLGDEQYYAEQKCETLEGLDDLVDKYGVYLDPLSFCDGYIVDIPEPDADKILEILYGAAFAPYIECAREKELPAPQPGTMYRTEGAPKSFADVTWGERLATLKCDYCQNTEYNEWREFFPLILEDDNGEHVPIWCWCGDIWNLPDNLCAITEWNGETPAGVADCPWFEWD